MIRIARIDPQRVMIDMHVARAIGAEVLTLAREDDREAAALAGDRDPKLIETISMAEFKKGDVNPTPGLPINFKGRAGTVVTVGAGRVRVDFNSPLAGKRLKYRFTVRRVAKDATAGSAREATWSMVIAGIYQDPVQAERLKQWGRTYWRTVHPYNLEGAYINFMMDDEAEGRVQATYGDNYGRLASVKAQYDPKNLVRVNQNIQPAALSRP